MSFIGECFRSIHDFRAYKKLVQTSNFKIFLYVTILCIIMALFITVPTSLNLWQISSAITKNADKIPDFSVKKNNIDFKGDEPIIIKDKSITIIFDKNSDDSDAFKKADTAMLWGKTGRKMKKNGKVIGTVKYSEATNLTINKNYALQEAKGWKMLPLTNVLQNIVLAYIMIFLTTLIVIVVKSKNSYLGFRVIFKICQFAVTVPIIINSCLMGFGMTNIVQKGPILLAIQSFYAFKACRVIEASDDKKAKKEYYDTHQGDKAHLI